MTPKQREILTRAHSSFNVEMDRDDYDGIGRLLVVRRRLAELLGLPIKESLLPGESNDMDNDDYETRYTDPCTNLELDKADLNFIAETLSIANPIGGFNDGDDASLRCCKRMLAEIIDYEPLNHYRLLFEKEMKKIYVK